jgi:hypothetical protein
MAAGFVHKREALTKHFFTKIVICNHEGLERIDSFLGYAGSFLDQPCFNFTLRVRPTSFTLFRGVNHDLTQTNANTGRELSDEIRVHSWLNQEKKVRRRETQRSEPDWRAAVDRALRARC